jgi:hypothetical protein
MSDTPKTDAAAMPIDRIDTIASRPCNVVHEDVCRQLERELAEAREERDRLAEALEMIATHNHEDGQCDNGYTPSHIAKQALAAAKGGTPNNCQRPELCLLTETCIPCEICPNAVKGGTP